MEGLILIAIGFYIWIGLFVGLGYNIGNDNKNIVRGITYGTLWPLFGILYAIRYGKDMLKETYFIIKDIYAKR